MNLEKAGTIDELRGSLKTFAQALQAGDEKAEFAVRHPDYWVYDSLQDGYAPAKWVAYSGKGLPAFNPLRWKKGMVKITISTIPCSRLPSARQ